MKWLDEQSLYDGGSNRPERVRSESGYTILVFKNLPPPLFTKEGNRIFETVTHFPGLKEILDSRLRGNDKLKRERVIRDSNVLS
jgi:hypothetical protein